MSGDFVDMIGKSCPRAAKAAARRLHLRKSTLK
jgi:hypothetical protein